MKGVLPENFLYVCRKTRLNDKLLSEKSKNKLVGEGFYQNGIEIKFKQQNNTFHLKVWTVENKQHVLSFRCVLTNDFKVLRGVVNCFQLGFIKIDQDYVDAFLEELQEKDWQWDQIDLAK